MAAIGYLLRKSIKNWIFELRHKPQNIILIAFIALMMICGGFGPSGSALKKADPQLISSLFLVAGLIFGGLTLYGGLSETRSYFRLADVNLMFTSPINPAHVIVYGMIRNIGSLALAMLMLVYQTANLKYNLGMTSSMIALTFIDIFIMLVICLLTSMCLMLLSSGRPQRQSNFKRIFIGVLALLLIYAIYTGSRNSGLNGFNLFKLICGNPSLDYIPIIGWARGFTVALMFHDIPRALLFGFLSLALAAVEVIAIVHTKTDYYEDVLDGASRKQQALDAVKSGDRAHIRAFKPKTNIRKFGINKGYGASAFLYKRLLERRRGAIGAVSFTTVFICAAGIFLSVALHAPYMLFLGVAAGLNLFLQRINSWESELNQNFIFLVPSEPYHKLFFSILPDLYTSLTDSVFVLIIGAFLFKMNPVYALIGAVAYFSVSLLITGSSVVVRRIFGADTKNPLVQIFAIYLPLIVMGIGIFPAVIAQFALAGGASFSFPVIAISAVAVWDILLSALLLFLGKGVLNSYAGN